MAVYIAAADGNLSDAATVWATVDATSFLRSTANSTALTTAYVESQTFTPGAITIDGISVLVLSRIASPTGTISIRLAQAGVTVAGTEVTINVSDIESTAASGQAAGDYLFKFAAPVLLVAATLYTVSAKCSVNGEVTLYRNATAGNWSRMLRTTTIGNPGAGDDWHVLGEWTAAGTKTNRSVTNDETVAVDYGSGGTDIGTPSITVGKGGTLASGIAAATNYVLRMSACMRAWQGSIFNIGTVGGEIPRGSTSTVEFDCAADGDFGLVIEGACNWQGLSYTAGKNVVQCKLNTDEAAAQTTLGVDTDTGWPTGATIWIASTSRTSTQTEERVLNGAAGASSIVVTVGLTNAHSGTSPTQAEVVLIDRPITIKSVSATAMAYVLVNLSGQLNADWVRFQNLGVTTDLKRGLQLRPNTAYGGFATLDFCGVDDFEQFGINIGSGSVGAEAVTVNDTVITSNFAAAQAAGLYLEATTGTITLTRVTCLGLFGSGNRIGFDFEVAPNLTATDLVAQGCVTGINIQAGTSDSGTFDGLTCHSNSGSGLVLTNSGSITISDVHIWRNNGASGGISIGTGWYVIDGGEVFGNGTAGNLHNLSASTTVAFCHLKNLTVAGDTTFAVDNGLFLSQGSEFIRFKIENCDFSPTSGIFVAHAAEDIFLGADNYEITLIDTPLRATQEIDTGSANTAGRSFIAYQRQDGTTNTHKTVYAHGTVERDASVFRTAAPSEKCSPTTLWPNFRLRSGVRRKPVRSGETVSFSVYVRKSAAYNGSAPRLVIASNAAVGIDADVVGATHSAAADTWQNLSYTTVAAAEDGVVTAYVDGNGTAGSFYTDDWA